MWYFYYVSNLARMAWLCWEGPLFLWQQLQTCNAVFSRRRNSRSRRGEAQQARRPRIGVYHPVEHVGMLHMGFPLQFGFSSMFDHYPFGMTSSPG